jgi:hypothetical protein
MGESEGAAGRNRHSRWLKYFMAIAALSVPEVRRNINEGVIRQGCIKIGEEGGEAGQMGLRPA